MRVLVVVSLLVAIAFAGCTQGTPDRDEEFQPTCPSWIKGLDSMVVSGPGFFHRNGTNSENWDSEVNGTLRGFGVVQKNGHPLDFIEMDFHVRRDRDGNVALQNGTPVQQYLYVEKGILQVQFFNNRTGEVLQVYDSSRGPPGPNNPADDLLSWEPGLYTNFTLHIALADPSDPPSPDEVVGHWMLLGPRTGNGDSSAWAQRDATYHYWYRTCNADGSAALA